ncbi:MAG: CTP--2,3-di-O-geranylgeranyl-sn-glycero-1-phosphate cytidyltransferase [Nanoarchaeota archaeon]|nr:CTP--2,3-di-O-geranylgeranyl-sn-glycero-1-phosphate cytidyltransferase [Nanoarchaeota archaeon]
MVYSLLTSKHLRVRLFNDLQMRNKIKGELTKKEKLYFEIKRKFVHAFGIFFVLIYWIFMKLYNHQTGLLVLIGILLFFVVIEFFRIYEGKRIPIIHFLWREKEENSLGGQVYFVLGVILALSIFDFNIALSVILMTTFGDMAAALFGIAFGSHWVKHLRNKAWEGIIAEFAVDLTIGFLIIRSWPLAIPIALTATVVETIFPHIDDNLAVPTFSGFVGQCIKIILT